MAAVLDIGDLYFPAASVPLSHLQDAPRVNPAYVASSLSLPPVPKFPEPKLNFVCWPITGLSHYAIGHVLVANDVGATTATSVTLSLTDDDVDVARTLAITVLNRRPLSDTRATLVTSPSGSVVDPFDGWILTLVDSRYLRRKIIASGDTIARSTWGELINSLGTAAGFTMQSASTIQALVHADFGAPDSTAWSPATLAGEGYSVAADAAAHGCGLRLVVATDGTVTAQVAATSTTAYTAWLTATGRDEFSSGGIVEDRYSAPRNVQCDGTDVAMPSPTTRMTDRDTADLPSTGSTFRTAWVQAYSDWLAATSVTADIRGFVLPPVCGTQQHVEYSLDGCRTRVVKHPSRYPLPLMIRDRGSGGGSSLQTINSDGSDNVLTTAKITASLPDGLEFDASSPNTTLKGIDATRTQKGMVTVFDQGWTGAKASYDSATASSGWQTDAAAANGNTIVSPSSYSVTDDGVTLLYPVAGGLSLRPAEVSATNPYVDVDDDSPITILSHINGLNLKRYGACFFASDVGSDGTVFTVGSVEPGFTGTGAINRFAVLRHPSTIDILHQGIDDAGTGLVIPSDIIGGIVTGTRDITADVMAAASGGTADFIQWTFGGGMPTVVANRNAALNHVSTGLYEVDFTGSPPATFGVNISGSDQSGTLVLGGVVSYSGATATIQFRDLSGTATDPDRAVVQGVW